MTKICIYFNKILKENTSILFFRGEDCYYFVQIFKVFLFVCNILNLLFFCYVVWEYVMLLFKLLFLLQHSEKNCVGSGSDLNPRSWVSTWKISFGTHPEASSLLIIIISRQQKYHKTITNSQNNVNTYRKKKSPFFVFCHHLFQGKNYHICSYFFTYIIKAKIKVL